MPGPLPVAWGDPSYFVINPNLASSLKPKRQPLNAEGLPEEPHASSANPDPETDLKALLASVDVMMDEMGAQGVFADGFLWGYGGEYTYDRWDGHSADIDPKTQTIARKKASVKTKPVVAKAKKTAAKAQPKPAKPAAAKKAKAA